MGDLIIDKEAFLRRIRKFYSFWKVNVLVLWVNGQKIDTQFWPVSLKHDGPDGTVKMANLPVLSVSDGRDRLSRLSQTGQSDGC